MRDTTLDARLSSVSALVRQDATLADIGTDHAYLPIFLLRTGRISRAILTDINEGPLAAAKEHATDAGVLDRVEFILTDGAAATRGMGATDYTICGMGGELIADIISRADHLRDPEVRLILQPMTRHATLREYLLTSGFDILSESYSYAEGKYYLTILAVYSGECRTLDPITAEIGVCAHPCNINAYLGYLNAKRERLLHILSAKGHGGHDVEAENSLLGAIEERIAYIERTKKTDDSI